MGRSGRTTAPCESSIYCERDLLRSPGGFDYHRGSMAKHSPSILEMARKGATHRLAELKAEIAELVKAFPHLRYGSAVSPSVPANGVEERLIRKEAKRRRRMSAAARKAVSVRMKKYWATRRNAKKRQR